MLSDDERYWELSIHARDLREIEDPSSENPTQYDKNIEYTDVDTGTFLIRYESFEYWFEEEFPEAEIYSADFEL